MDIVDRGKDGDNTQKIKKKKPSLLVLHLIEQSVESKFHIKYHEENVEVFLHNKNYYDVLNKV